MTKLSLSLLSFCVLAVLAACSGNIQGVVRGTGQPVLFSYEEGMSSDRLAAVIDGEEFVGKAVMRGASTTVGTVFGSAIDGAFGTSTLVGSRYTGDVVAMLIGNRGATLSCQLQYADSSGSTSFGGVGVCQHSDGRVIDMVW